MTTRRLQPLDRVQILQSAPPPVRGKTGTVVQVDDQASPWITVQADGDDLPTWMHSTDVELIQPAFEVHDRVKVNNHQSTSHGEAGTVVQRDTGRIESYRVKLDGATYPSWWLPQELKPETE